MTGVFVLDRAAILERLGGDEEIYSMMVEMYLQDVENNCSALAASVVAGVLPDLQREAHTIKGLLATFSDDEGAAEAHAVEQKAKHGDLQGVDAAVLVLQTRLREVAAVLKAARSHQEFAGADRAAGRPVRHDAEQRCRHQGLQRR